MSDQSIALKSNGIGHTCTVCGVMVFRLSSNGWTIAALTYKWLQLMIEDKHFFVGLPILMIIYVQS